MKLWSGSFNNKRKSVYTRRYSGKVVVLMKRVALALALICLWSSAELRFDPNSIGGKVMSLNWRMHILNTINVVRRYIWVGLDTIQLQIFCESPLHIHISPEHTLSIHSTSLLTVVRFLYPSAVMTTSSSILTPPTDSYFLRMSWLMCLESRIGARRWGEK